MQPLTLLEITVLKAITKPKQFANAIESLSFDAIRKILRLLPPTLRLQLRHHSTRMFEAVVHVDAWKDIQWVSVRTNALPNVSYTR